MEDISLTFKETNIVVEKRKIYKRLLMGVLIVSFFFMSIIGYVIYWAFYDMVRLPTGDYLTEATSPDGKYTLKAYVTNGGATAAYAVRGELVFNEKEDKTKNIYWNYHDETAVIHWIANNKVVINGYTLTIPNEKFDFRHE